MIDDRQGAQLSRSATRVFGVWLSSPQGRYIFNLFERAVFGAFVAFAAWNASTEHSVTAWRAAYAQIGEQTYYATVRGQCLDWAILAKVEKKKYVLPTWCQGPLEHLAGQPPALPEMPAP